MKSIILQTKKTIRRARRGVEEASARFVTVVFVIGLRIKTGQILDATSLHRIFTSDDITGAEPTREACVVIKMGGVRRHAATLARLLDRIRS